MKILKFLVITVSLLLIGFLLIPVFVPTVIVETRIVVNKPAHRAFEVFIDTSNMPAWMTGFRAIETISGEPNTPGSRYRLFFEEEGREIVMTEEITSFKPAELMAFTMENEMMANNTTVRFADRGDSTEIIGTTVMDGKGIFWGGALPLMKSMIGKRSEEDYGKLKIVIDSAP